MAKTIWKYAIQPESVLELPSQAQFLDVQTQQDKAVAWFLVDPANPKVTRRFRAYGTGHTLSNNPGKFLGSFQLEGGHWFHLFEEF